MRTLRVRLILSHVLPLLVIILLTGITLEYVLETQVLLATLVDELTNEALLVAELASDRPELWNEPAQAQAVVDRIGLRLTAQAMLLDAEGRLLAQVDPTGAKGVEQIAREIPDLDGVLAGKVQIHTQYSWNRQADVIDVMVPVWGPENQVIGVVRFTHRLSNVHRQFLNMRYLVAGVLFSGLILGIIVAWSLALNLGRALQQVTQAVHNLASGQRLEPLSERGPDEIRLLSRAVNTLVERLQTLEGARRRLLANLVHELGRPLGALLAAVQALQGGADQDPAMRQTILSGMQAEIVRLGRLLDDLTQLHDRVAGTMQVEHRPVFLNQWLPDVLGPWQEVAQAQGLNWQVALPADLPVLNMDADRMAQVLGNLLSNAVKFTSPGDTVSVAAGIKDEQVWMRVSDTGPGIPPAEHPRVFSPFFRGRSSHRFPQGMGLGLSIARDLVAAHDGRLEMTSAPGQGSCFTIWLPFKPGQTQ